MVLAGMALLRGDIANRPMIPSFIIIGDKAVDEKFQLMEREDILETQPLIFEDPKAAIKHIEDKLTAKITAQMQGFTDTSDKAAKKQEFFKQEAVRAGLDPIRVLTPLDQITIDFDSDNDELINKTTKEPLTSEIKTLSNGKSVFKTFKMRN